MPAARSNIQRLVKESQVVSSALGARLLSGVGEVVAAADSRYYLATVDLATDLYYAPISTFTPDRIATALGVKKEEVLDTLRDHFRLAHVGTGFVAKLCRLAIEQRRSSEFLLVAFLDNSGSLRSLERFNAQGRRQRLPQRFSVMWRDESRVGAEVNDIMESLRTKPQATWQKCIVVRPELIIRSPNRNRLIKTVQVGMMLAKPSDGVLPESLLVALVGAARTSSFATVSMLYERERYYQKALRQAVRGDIIKCGPGEDIESQATELKRLEKKRRYFVPTILDHDPDAHIDPDTLRRNGTNAPQLAWYRMPRFTLPPLLDLLTTTEGLKNYEVEVIVRRCFAHLRDTYWLADGSNLVVQSQKTRELFAAPLAISRMRVHKACKQMLDRRDQVKKPAPIKGRMGIKLCEELQDEDVDRIFATMELSSKRKYRVRTIWNDSDDDNGQKCDSPFVAFDRLKRLITSIPRGQESRRCRMQNGLLHGDAHFGNLLIDASIPEDPLVMSIDQTKLEYEDKEAKLLRGESPRCRDSFLDEVRAVLEQDIVYDVAKLMLSACGYSLAYRSAFRIQIKKLLRYDQFDLERRVEEEFTPLDEVGGISGSQIIKIAAPVTSDALRYHDVARAVILDEYLKLCKEIFGDAQQADLMLSLVRLWLLTVRHAFSVAELLYPMHGDRGLVMYLLASQLLNAGLPIVEKVVKSGFEERYISTFCCRVFQTDFDENTGVRPLKRTAPVG